MPSEARLAGALDARRRRQRKDGTWPLRRVYPGRTWFPLEAPAPSRWATLRARRVPAWWDDRTDA